MHIGRQMKCLRYSALIFAALLLDASNVEAAPTQWLHARWTTENGLPQNSVEAMVRDRLGYLWLGTQEGLVRYDGDRFVVFGPESGLGCPEIRALSTTAQGEVVVGTIGCGAFVLQRDTMTRLEGVPPDARVNALSRTSDGAILVATDKGLVAVSPTGAVWLYRGADVVSVAVGDQADIYFAIRGAVAHRVGASLTWLTRANGVPGSDISSLAVEHDAVWVATRDGGLARISAAGASQFGEQEGLPALDVESVSIVKDGEVWVATSSGVAHLEGGRFLRLEVENGPQSALSLLGEDANTLWIGDSNTGLHQLRPGHIKTYGTQSGLVDPVVWTMFQDRDGTLWAGTEHGGLHRWAGGRFVPLARDPETKLGTVFSIEQAPDGSHWAGTSTGLFHWDGQHRELFTQSAGLPATDVYSVRFDAAGILWACTGQGLVKREPGGAFVDISKQLGIPPGQCQLLTFDATGTMWVGGSDLFGRIVQGRFISQPLRDRPNVTAMAFTASGAMLVGTTTGLAQIANGQVRWLDPAQGLFESHVIGIAEDRSGSVWFITNKGPFRIARDQLALAFEGKVARLSIEAYNTRDGMKSAECNASSSTSLLAARDGTLWVPTVAGVSVFDPSTLAAAATPIIPLIEGTLDPRRPAPLRYAPALVLEPGTRDLELRYTAAEFSNPEKVTFRYQLVGNDASWVEAGPRRSAWYTNLKPGQYRFLVDARVGTGPWSQAPAAVSIELLPHFYETWWFVGGLVVFFAALALALWRARVASLKLRERELRRRVEDRTAELKVALDRSAQSETSFRTLTERLPISVVVSMNGAYVFGNAEALRLTGCASMEELLASPLARFTHPDEVGLSEARWKQLASGSSTKAREGRVVRTDGTIAIAELWGVPITYQGEPATLSLARDITDRRLLEQKLTATERMASVGTLAAGVAHEIGSDPIRWTGWLSLFTSP